MPPRLVNNRGAQALGHATGLAQVANTDSHMLWTIGRCANEFPGTSTRALRRALEQHTTRPWIGARPATTWQAGWPSGQCGWQASAMGARTPERRSPSAA